MSDQQPALVEAAMRGITPFELRLDQEAFYRGIGYALEHKMPGAALFDEVSRLRNIIGVVRQAVAESRRNGFSPCVIDTIEKEVTS